MSDKRKDYITWDEYFMGVAILASMRSKDPNTQVGACIVSQDNKILSMGYNGFPMGCSDDEYPWSREAEGLDSKYLYTTHSELNAILNYRGGSLEGATLYVTLFPCNECAKAIIQAGIKKLVYDSDKCTGIQADAEISRGRDGFVSEIRKKNHVECVSRFFQVLRYISDIHEIFHYRYEITKYSAAAVQ